MNKKPTLINYFKNFINLFVFIVFFFFLWELIGVLHYWIIQLTNNLK